MLLQSFSLDVNADLLTRLLDHLYFLLGAFLLIYFQSEKLYFEILRRTRVVKRHVVQVHY